MKTTRTYTMTARAEAAERTRLAILDSMVSLATSRLLVEISLEDVAAAAGVSVQTVLRRFGSRAGLVEAAYAHAVAEVEDERTAPVGDLAAAVAVIVEHYERRGDGVVLMLAQESSDDTVRRFTENGRRMHRAWVETVFAPYLPPAATSPAAREERVDLLGVATDVYTWKQLRRDRGHDRHTTEQRIHALVAALTSQE
ncbi:MAG TPA: TetR/AcrR family transcriptional regulator [Nocardioides bacterium]|uniref:TetR/AcrR family transcriptional regulator n=1 Tax=uncultured Nocardioides sp. TaxID=198441 RepID=UPI000ED29F18|nr:TetR/AcrR family transcriptional regulator [uncultured Nocardioides sp.]HCB07056.1 TetR/AcrR family transcriptional regulator [Nocardioides sp.]HRK46055.1 TetR/AcrR family transcriptional regulator [Nocardioides sp.]